MQHSTDKPDTDEPTPWSRAWKVLAAFFVGNVVVGGLHVAFPDRVDLPAMIFFELSFAPLLLLLFRTFQVGFGEWKVGGSIGRFGKVDTAITTLRGLEIRAEPIPVRTRAQPMLIDVRAAEITRAESRYDDVSAVAGADDDVVFVRLRGEIERRLRRLAAANGIELQGKTAAQLSEELARGGVLNEPESRALREVLRAGSAQAHGDRVPAALAEYARTEGPGIVSALDSLAWAPHSQIKQRITALAAQNGRTATDQNTIIFGDRNLQPDLRIDDDLIVDIASVEAMSDPSPTFLSERCRRYSAATGKPVLLVLPLAVTPERRTGTVDLLESDPDVAIAWKDHERFEGTPRAHALAPWLFTPSA